MAFAPSNEPRLSWPFSEITRSNLFLAGAWCRADDSGRGSRGSASRWNPSGHDRTQCEIRFLKVSSRNDPQPPFWTAVHAERRSVLNFACRRAQCCCAKMVLHHSQAHGKIKYVTKLKKVSDVQSESHRFPRKVWSLAWRKEKKRIAKNNSKSHATSNWDSVIYNVVSTFTKYLVMTRKLLIIRSPEIVGRRLNDASPKCGLLVHLDSISTYILRTIRNWRLLMV